MEAEKAKARPEDNPEDEDVVIKTEILTEDPDLTNDILNQEADVKSEEASETDHDDEVRIERFDSESFILLTFRSRKKKCSIVEFVTKNSIQSFVSIATGARPSFNLEKKRTKSRLLK